MSWPQPAPLLRQGSDRLTRFERHLHGPERRVVYGHRVVEDHHHAIASITFKRPAIFDDDFANGRVVVAQQSHYVFRVRAFSKPSEAAQVAEERSNLPAVAFKLFLCARRDDQISHLRRKEPPQPAHALDLAYLVGDALFELLVELLNVVCSLAQFFQKSRVLDGDNSLIGKVRQ